MNFLDEVLSEIFLIFLILVENKSWAFVEIQSSDTRRGVGQTLCSHLCNAIKRTLGVYDGVIAKMENIKLKCLEIHCFLKNTAKCCCFISCAHVYNTQESMHELELHHAHSIRALICVYNLKCVLLTWKNIALPSSLQKLVTG